MSDETKNEDVIEEEKVSELIYYNSNILGNICYKDDEYIVGENEHLKYIGKSNKPTQPIGLTDYAFMFEEREDLVSIDLSDWDMSKATNLIAMFRHCRKLKDISSLENWNVSNVRYMDHMFYCCYELENIISLQKWDVHHVRGMGFMFSDCSKLADISPLGNWFDKNKYNLSISNWIKVLIKGFAIYDISYMFDNCVSLNNILPLKDWDVKSINNFNSLFMGCTSLKDVSPLKEWKVSFYSNKEDMFSEVDFKSQNRMIDKVNTYKIVDRSNKDLNKHIMKLYKKMLQNNSNTSNRYYCCSEVFDLIKYINNNNLVTFIPSYYILCLFKLIDYSIIDNLNDINNNMKNLVCNNYSPYHMYSLHQLYYDEYFKFSASVLYFKMYQFKDSIMITTDLWDSVKYYSIRSNNMCKAYINCKY